MEIEDILKLLVVALFLIPGLFGKKKKKEDTRRQQPTEVREYDDPFKDFETFERDDDFREEYEMQQNPVNVHTQTIDIIPEEEGTSVFAQSQIEKALALIAKQESSNNEISQNEIHGVETDADTDNNDFLTDFDARQALIYSEIFNSKYV
ncbi:MAG: hypothetical protein LBT56_04115 [Prevotellaceae bacterium]|jgi:hypothetical protein|nr:hypothetical protein [Prevotellaceae bacterium]